MIIRDVDQATEKRGCWAKLGCNWNSPQGRNQQLRRQDSSNSSIGEISPYPRDALTFP
mgnify:FL=1